ncbi:MAG: hypothetical protein K0S23_1233 [Fluviicola sp.]|jgi:hypothetical protein|uniref:DKNYY domain-containing protein n=1 Tax=Fluviicola sp. TaxID=1917219 RepID=UPI002628DF8E|nr:DKNYY domain-containing protein [Fluviicola sp.]MDF3026926.1 hypothetical protein [Fluviicola sp.]
MRQLFYYLTILLLLSSCGQPTKYVVKNNLVYFQGWNEAKGNYEVLLKGVSAKSFKVIDTDCNMIVGKDNKSVFIDYSKLENADASSFEYIGNYFFKSKDSVYFFGFYNSFDDCEVVGVNPATFQIDKKYPWAYDRHLVIYGHTVLDSVDFESFKVIDKLKAQDKYANYVDGKRVIRK